MIVERGAADAQGSPRLEHNWGAMTCLLLCKRSSGLVLITITSLKYYPPTPFVESPTELAARAIVPP